MVDPRDGQAYVTVKYTVTYPDQSSHSHTWMAKNLNFDLEGSHCYKDMAESCGIYGRLYT